MKIDVEPNNRPSPADIRPLYPRVSYRIARLPKVPSMSLAPLVSYVRRYTKNIERTPFVHHLYTRIYSIVTRFSKPLGNGIFDRLAYALFEKIYTMTWCHHCYQMLDGTTDFQAAYVPVYCSQTCEKQSVRESAAFAHWMNEMIADTIKHRDNPISTPTH